MTDLTLPDSRGQNIALNSLWQERPVAFYFMRHIG